MGGRYGVKFAEVSRSAGEPGFAGRCRAHGRGQARANAGARAGRGGRLQVEDEPLFADRMAGLDIAKAVAEVTIRVPRDTARGSRRQETRTFGGTRRELLDLAG